VDQAEDRIRAATFLEALCDIFCAYPPAILGLMAREAGSAIGTHILEEGVICREGRTVWLECCDRAFWIDIHLEAINHRRRVLTAVISISVAAHFVHVIDHDRSKGRRALGPAGLLRQRNLR